jgi:hypothetical protein
MKGEQKIDDTLIVSETSLAYVPEKKFHVNSWHIFDGFIDYAIDVFTTTVASLMKNGYLRIKEEEIKSFKAFGVSIWRNINYQIQLTKKPSEEFIVGWVEERIFEQLKYSTHNYFDVIVNGVLNEVFDKNHNLTNPGKVFTLEILRHQRINLYEFNYENSWISDSVTLWHNKNSFTHIKPRVLTLVDFSSDEIEIIKLRKIIASQFRKFRNFD